MHVQMAYTPADTAPITGVYELLNPGGASSTPVCVPVFRGTSFPAVPQGWQWRLTDVNLPAD